MAIYLQEREVSKERFRLPDWNKAREVLEEAGLVKKVEPTLTPSSDELRLRSVRAELQNHAQTLLNSDFSPERSIPPLLSPKISHGSPLEILSQKIRK
jgi:hypothetical protein